MAILCTNAHHFRSRPCTNLCPFHLPKRIHREVHRGYISSLLCTPRRNDSYKEISPQLRIRDLDKGCILDIPSVSCVVQMAPSKVHRFLMIIFYLIPKVCSNTTSHTLPGHFLWLPAVSKVSGRWHIHCIFFYIPFLIIDIFFFSSTRAVRLSPLVFSLHRLSETASSRHPRHSRCSDSYPYRSGCGRYRCS